MLEVCAILTFVHLGFLALRSKTDPRDTQVSKKIVRVDVEIRILGGVLNGGQCRCWRCSS
jgi:hypothetical protein